LLGGAPFMVRMMVWDLLKFWLTGNW